MSNYLLDALESCEAVLSEKWKEETLNFAVRNQDLYLRPDLCAKIVDRYGVATYPTAAALTQAREAIAKARGES
jgi:hypothetical protein